MVIGAVFLSAYPPCRLPAQYAPDDRVLISDFSYVDAIAASPSLVFAATPHGLVIYDRMARAWRLPVTSLDGYPAARVRVALADPVGNAVWLGTALGLARYDADLRAWESAYAMGGVTSLMLDATDPASGIYALTPGGWSFVPRGGLAAIPGQPLPPPGRRIVPLDAETALRLAPAADALRAFILTDARLRAYRFTAAARTADRTELFFGTNGMGMVRFDATSGERETLAFGLLARRAGAVTVWRDGVWVTSLSAVGERRGLTWVAADLSLDSTVEGAGVAGFGCFEGRKIVAAGPFLWVACERGLLRIETGTWRSRVFDAGRGLAADNVLSVAVAGDGAWAGTSRGLSFVAADERVTNVPGIEQPVLSLLAVRDTLWVGGTAGLGLVLPGTRAVGVPPDVAAQPSLRAPILALAVVNGTLVVATPDHFAWRDPATHEWRLLHARADLGAIAALAGDDAAGGVWAAGAAALAFFDLARGTFHVLRVPFDVPAAVHDVAVDAHYVWAATDSGLVRFSRGAVLGP
jgi:ligand-binding sensor domain-containing protein